MQKAPAVHLAGVFLLLTFSQRVRAPTKKATRWSPLPNPNISCTALVLVPAGLAGEEFSVQWRELGPLIWQLIFREARVNRAGLNAGIAVDALVRVNVKLLSLFEAWFIRCWVNAVNWTNLCARGVFGSDAWFCDYVRQWCSFLVLKIERGFYPQELEDRQIGVTIAIFLP